MEPMDWLQMLTKRQSLHRFARRLLGQSRACTLSTSELELLSLLYLDPQANTPLALSERSGMKKEAVSRCIRQLMLRGSLEKTPNPLDERSYSLSLTGTGLQLLEENYGRILQPMYALQRRMGPDFAELFRLLEEADRLLAAPQIHDEENGEKTSE